MWKYLTAAIFGTIAAYEALLKMHKSNDDDEMFFTFMDFMAFELFLVFCVVFTGG